MADDGSAQRAVVVTGASRGIGRTIALDLSEYGFGVFAGVRKSADAEFLREDSNGRVSPLILDVTDPAGVKAAAKKIADATNDQGIGGVVNNAGVAAFGPVEQASMSSVNHQLQVNLIGALTVTQLFLPHLRKGKGRIVNISSVNGRLSIPFSGVYSATKFALEAVSDALRIELKRWGISVSIVEPGAVDTDIRSVAMDLWAKSRGELSEDDRELYEESLQRLRGILKNVEATAAGHEHVSRAVLHALTAETPQTRYQAGPDWEQWAPLMTLSDEDRDRAFLEMFQ
jgi:NAD(P)-dependent dehydrogenase (short-subunit alcohol dehydrogenase family)